MKHRDPIDFMVVSENKRYSLAFSNLTHEDAEIIMCAVWTQQARRDGAHDPDLLREMLERLETPHARYTEIANDPAVQSVVGAMIAADAMAKKKLH